MIDVVVVDVDLMAAAGGCDAVVGSAISVVSARSNASVRDKAEKLIAPSPRCDAVVTGTSRGVCCGSAGG